MAVKRDETGRLEPAGLDIDEANPIRRVQRARAACFGAGGEVYTVRAPGRVNLIGDHTDYNDGFVLPITIDRAVYVALRPRTDQQVRLVSLNFDQRITYPLGERPAVPPSSWAGYVTGVIEELLQRGAVDAGFEAAVYGDVPVGAGLSSSAALEVAVAVGLQTLFGFDLDPVEAATLCQRVEHRYVGVQCGIMDQFASRLGRAGHALFLDCRTLAYEQVPLVLEDVALVIVDSKASRALADSKYNERRGECAAGVAFFRSIEPSITALRDVSMPLLDAYAEALPEPVQKRCRHVVAENQRVVEAGNKLRQRDFEGFGALMTASHASLRHLYEVSSSHLDMLVETALSVEGVLGARLTGAGFGGCTVNLVRRDAVPRLEARLREQYQKAFSLEPAVYVVEKNIEAGVV